MWFRVTATGDILIFSLQVKLTYPWVATGRL